MTIRNAFDQLHASLLAEAVNAPNLFADLAGLEQYVSESYNARSFIELLQNADDAGAKRFHIADVDGLLVVANDGAEFKPSDLESLCRSSASSKSRGETIGYRGIGFKSVVGFAERVHLISGELTTTFCRQLTKSEVPGSKRVPLVRIPHALDLPFSVELEGVVRELRSNGYSTIFIFEELDHKSVLTEFKTFDGDSFLFLRSVAEANIGGESTERYSIETVFEDKTIRRLSVTSRSGRSEWVLRSLGAVQVAFITKNGVPDPVPLKQAVAHAFLPTNEPTGFGLKINGDFSTDPSRTKIVLDDRSAICINDTARLILNCLEEAITTQSKEAVAPFVAREDLRVYELAKPSFERSLATEVLKQGRGLMRHFRLRPSWIESNDDFEAIIQSTDNATVSAELDALTGFATMLRSFGAASMSGSEVALATKNCKISVGTGIAILSHYKDLEMAGQLDFDIDKCRIWPTASGLMTGSELRNKPTSLSEIDLLIERFGSTSALLKFTTRIFGQHLARTLLPEAVNQPTRNSETIKQHVDVSFLSTKLLGNHPNIKNRSDSVKANHNYRFTKWRTVEVQVKEYLESKGWEVIDVSLRNLGYDLEAISPDSVKHFFEVKSINRVGEYISLTSNEEVVAREKGKKYVLTIAMLTDRFFDIEFITDPIRSLELVRQCKQWAWICDSYPYNPERIPLVD